MLYQSQCHICGASDSQEQLHDLTTFRILRCSVCGILQKWPLPSRNEVYDLYNNPEYWSRPYFRKCYSLPERPNRIYRLGLMHLARRHPTRGRLLDVGCGTGSFLVAARDAGWHVRGVECSAHAVRHASNEFGLEVAHGLIEEVDLPLQSFRAITLWDVIEHLTNPKAVIEKLALALEPRGSLLVFTPNADSFVRTMAPFLDRIFSKDQLFARTVYPPPHTYYFHKRSLSLLLAPHSLQICSNFQLPMAPGRAAKASSGQRMVLRLMDTIGFLLRRRYRLLAMASKGRS